MTKCAILVSFNEAPPFQAGKLDYRASSAAIGTGFNEAPPFQAGKQHNQSSV